VFLFFWGRIVFLQLRHLIRLRHLLPAGAGRALKEKGFNDSIVGDGGDLSFCNFFTSFAFGTFFLQGRDRLSRRRV